jgi:hypothetical protein
MLDCGLKSSSRQLLASFQPCSTKFITTMKLFFLTPRDGSNSHNFLGQLKHQALHEVDERQVRRLEHHHRQPQLLHQARFTQERDP